MKCAALVLWAFADDNHFKLTTSPHAISCGMFKAHNIEEKKNVMIFWGKKEGWFVARLHHEFCVQEDWPTGQSSMIYTPEVYRVQNSDILLIKWIILCLTLRVSMRMPLLFVGYLHASHCPNGHRIWSEMRRMTNGITEHVSHALNTINIVFIVFCE